MRVETETMLRQITESIDRGSSAAGIVEESEMVQSRKGVNWPETILPISPLTDIVACGPDLTSLLIACDPWIEMPAERRPVLTPIQQGADF